jgi:spermidine synthase
MSIIDKSDDDIKIHYKFNGYLKEFNSAYQNIKIVNTNEFGTTLFLDDSLQSTEKDEYIYHEAMAHSLLSNIPNAKPKHVLILGGSEGYLAREILKWPNIYRIDQVDWDEDLVNHYKSLGNYPDMRVQVYHKDALEFLQVSLDNYDAIFVDLIDPCEESLGFFKELLQLSLLHLSKDGGIIANVGSVSPLKKGCADNLAGWLKDKITNRKALCIHVPSFMQAWCLLMGSKSLEITDYLPETRFFDADTVSCISRWSKDYSEELRFFNV